MLKTSESNPGWGYSCTATTIPDLGEFCDMDFAMVASDFSWTMLYTHEDFALGGPYFIQREWIVPEHGEVEKQGHRRKWRR
jgi:hypothetical protein